MTPQRVELEAARQVAHALGVPFVDLGEYRISAGILRKVPLDVAVKARCLPIVANPRRMVLVSDDPARVVIAASRPEELGLERRRLEFALTSEAAFETTLERRRALAD